MAKEKKDWKSTAEIPVPERLIDQIVGQEKSVEIIQKAAAQKRNVLLVGLPGTGKSMLAQAMAEILPLSQLQDILILPNGSDQNNPHVKAVKAGDGKKIVHKARLDAQKEDDNMRLMGFLLPMGWFLLAWVFWYLKWYSDIIFAALMLMGAFMFVGLVLGSQMKTRESKRTPKLLVDNSGKKTAPFIEATGARAGSLLGDVRHDPLQCHLGFNNLYVQKGESFVEKPFAELWSEIYAKYGKEIIRNEKGHEAIMLPAEEKIFTLGQKDGKVVLSRILSLNRQPFDGELVELNAGNKTIALTPEHKVFTSGNSKEASKIKFWDKLLQLEIKETILAIVHR
ncbi:MAG: ATP-binding protein [Candidatus ainarchaeum sp.]|nr:ATP-binding protein [Candidatus ainarchaeum sp.]